MQEITHKATDGDAGPSMKDLREVIPPHCFKAKPLWTSYYIVRDLSIVAGLAYLALTQFQSIENALLRYTLWAVYGLVQGCVFTGVWILAHECGHGALFHNNLTNNTWGLILHSFLGVPYFSWKFSHARHHRYTNHMGKDTAFVPAREDDFRATKAVADWLEIAEDTPLLNLIFILGHQILGWPLYLIFKITAGETSNPTLKEGQKTPLLNSHFDPLAAMFSPGQRHLVVITDLGLLAMGAGLYYLKMQYDWTTVFLLYGQPYLWVNHWIVMITFLHHTHPDAIHYEDGAWTFQKGALSTFDRDFGFVGRHLFHGIIEYHVIHHLFTHIPFYHAEEATTHVKELLGPRYVCVRTNIFADFWQTFVSCTHVVSDPEHPGELRYVPTTKHMIKPTI